jgi:hypothetical protein
MKTERLPKLESIYPPKGGPIVKDKPRVARASPYAGALSFGGTQSAM